MGIFADILNPNQKKTAKEIIASTKPAGSTNLPIQTSNKPKETVNKIIKDIKPAGSTPLPKPVTVPKRGEVISQASGNTTTQVPFKVRADEGKRIAEQLMGNQYDDDTVAGIVQNTIKGIPKASQDVLVDILQATARAVGTVGITSGNAFTNAMGIGPVFEDEISTKPLGKFGEILFGKDKNIKTGQKIVSDVSEKFVKPALASAGFDESTMLGSDTSTKLLSVPLVLGSLALDLSGWGGKAGVKTFLNEAPEWFFKNVAKEKSAKILEEKYIKGGLDEITAKNLAFETSKLDNVFDVKEAFINYGKSPTGQKSAFSSILSGGDNVVDNTVKKEVTKKYNTTVNIQDKDDITYLKRILSEDNVNDILKGKTTNFRGDSYEDLARVNIISEKPQTITQKLEGKIKPFKLDDSTVFHGTSPENINNILEQGFKKGSELSKDSFRGGGYGAIQDSISFSTDPKIASNFTGTGAKGALFRTSIKPEANIVKIDGITHAEDLNEFIPELKKQKVDGVYIPDEKEVVIINKSVIEKTKEYKEFNVINKNKELDGAFNKPATKPKIDQKQEEKYFSSLKKAIDESYVDEDELDEDLVDDLITKADKIGKELGYEIDYDDGFGGYEISLNKSIKDIKEAQDKIVAISKYFDVALKANPDGTITMYHGTSQKNADSIVKNGFESGTFFSPSTKKDFGGVSGASEYGDVIVKADLDPRELVFRTEGEYYAGKNIKNIEIVGKPKPETKPYKETGNLTTKILKDLEGKTTVSRQYILDSTNRQGISGSEVKIIKDVLAKTKGDVIEVAKFAEKVKKELIPLKVMTDRQRMMNDPNADEYFDYDVKRYENVSLPKETRGDVKNYKENVYQGKIKTNGSNSHFAESDKYMLHTRIEDMKDGVTRRVIEVQSDLYQKGGLESLKPIKNTNASYVLNDDEMQRYTDIKNRLYFLKNRVDFNIENPEVLRITKQLDDFEKRISEYKSKDYLQKEKEVAKLEQYKNPTIHFRGVREEIKKAVDDGIEKLQFPTGETAMKIEGLGQGQEARWVYQNNEGRNKKLLPEDLKVGLGIYDGDNWIITDVLGDGKFKAVPKGYLYRINDKPELISKLAGSPVGEIKVNGELKNYYPESMAEQFDISGKVDTSNPIYKFYENDLAKYVKNNYDAKLVTDDKGVTWNEVTITPQMGGPVTAFKAVDPKTFDYDYDITPAQAQKEILKLFSPDEIRLITGNQVDIAKLSGYGDEEFADEIDGFYKDQGDLGGIIGVVENRGKVASVSLYHESGHAFFNNFLSPADKKKYLDYVIKNKADELAKYQTDSYKTIESQAEEWIMDDFAREMRKDRTFENADGFFKKLYKNIVQTLKNILRKKTIFDDLYRRIKTKDRSYVKPKTRKILVKTLKRMEEKLPEELQRMKELIEIKQEVLDANPLKKLIKYQSTSRAGELPELNDALTKGKLGKFRQRGDVIIDEVMGYKYDYKDANDVEDVRSKFEKYMVERKNLKKMKEDYQKKRVEYYANKKAEVTKKDLAEKDEKALERILTNTARETEAIATKAVKQDEFQKILAETQKRLADEKAYKELKAQKTREARTVSFKRDSYYQTVKNAITRSLKPIKLLDPKSKEIYKEWKTKLIIAKELANLEASNFKSVPTKQGMQIINDYEAGKVTEYSKDIKTAFDSLRKEAISKGLSVPFRDNYVPHVYKENAVEIKNAIANYMVDKGVEKYIIDDYMSGIMDLSPELASKLKLNPSFTKERTLPTYKVALEYGLHPKYENPAQLIAHYRQEMEKTLANRDLMKRLEEEVKILPSSIAPKGWKEIELPFGKDRWYAKEDLAKIINSEIATRDITEFGISDRLWYSSAWISRKAQEIALSAGVPKSNINFFSLGVAIKELTYGNFKVISPFVRANFNNKSIEFFVENRSVIKDMAEQGIDIGSRIGNYADVYETLGKKWNNKEYVALFGQTFDKLFNEKTFGSFLPQLQIQIFKDTSKRGVKNGMSKEEADIFAGNVVRNILGIIEDTGRSKATEDKISAIFFAPKFRESIINVFVNTMKSGTTQIKNPEFYRNRRLIAGMILTFALYNYVNYKMNGNYMWDNEKGREFDLKFVRDNGEILYFPFMPSQLSFIRSMLSGTINLFKGDLKTSAQKFGGLFSMPVKIATEILTNSDYFGREIYKDTDTRTVKIQKIAKYMSLSVNHPYVKEVVTQLVDEEPKPIYQSLLIALEAPIKYSTLEKVELNQMYESQDNLKMEQIRAKDKFKATKYKELDKLIKDKDFEQLQKEVDKLSDSDYEIYKDIIASEKRAETAKTKASVITRYNKVIEYQNKKDVENAQAILDGFTDEEYKAYVSLFKQYKGKTTVQSKAEDDIVKLTWKYAKAFSKDPSNAYKALFGDEIIGDVEGKLVELKRFRDVEFTDEGGSEEYVRKLLIDAGIPLTERSNYNLEHITPVSAGGGTDPENLYLEKREIHNSYTQVDIVAGKLVRAGKLKRKEVTEVMNKLKVEKLLTPDEAIAELNRLAK